MWVASRIYRVGHAYDWQEGVDSRGVALGETAVIHFCFRLAFLIDSIANRFLWLDRKCGPLKSQFKNPN